MWWHFCNNGNINLTNLHPKKTEKKFPLILTVYPIDPHLIPLQSTPASCLEIDESLEKRKNVALFGSHTISSLMYHEKLKAPTIYIAVQI